MTRTGEPRALGRGRSPWIAAALVALAGCGADVPAVADATSCGTSGPVVVTDNATVSNGTELD